MTNRRTRSERNNQQSGIFCRGDLYAVVEPNYYRGRIANDIKGFTPKDMGAPPPISATDGRANSNGISRLYLTNNRETTLHEIRAAEYDYITIGTFKPNTPIKVVDLSNISHISPFIEDIDCTALAINKDTLQRINEDMSKTKRR